MKKFTESSIYTTTAQSPFMNGQVVNNKLMAIISNKAPGTKIINRQLEDALKNIERQKNSPIIGKVVDAVNSGKILLFISTPEYSIPACIPYVTYKQNDKPKCAVNLSKYVVPVTNAEKEIIRYDIAPRTLEAIITAAYLDYALFSKKEASLSIDAMHTMAFLWAKMFNKVLQRAIALSTNKDRYDAFMYFAYRFFLINMLELPSRMVDDLCNKMTNGVKNPVIRMIESNLEEHQVDWTSDISNFCKMLFNNEITNTKGIKVNNIAEVMNEHFYYRKFIDMFHYPAFMALAAPSYFMFTLVAVYNKATELVSVNALEDLVKESTMFNKMMVSLYREI